MSQRSRSVRSIINRWYGNFHSPCLDVRFTKNFGCMINRGARYKVYATIHTSQLSTEWSDCHPARAGRPIAPFQNLARRPAHVQGDGSCGALVAPCGALVAPRTRATATRPLATAALTARARSHRWWSRAARSRGRCEFAKRRRCRTQWRPGGARRARCRFIAARRKLDVLCKF